MKYKPFDEVFEDKTKYGTKIKTDEYQGSGAHIIVDQGQEQIAGYTDLDEGLFVDVPAIVFGDHTRVIKYVDEPFFLGADGVKVLRSRYDDANYRYLYYALLHAKIPNTGYNRHFKWLKETFIPYPDAVKQAEIVRVLDSCKDIIAKRQQELSALDDLIKARFVEMFGEPISNSKRLPMRKIGELCNLKAGDFTAAEDIYDIQDNDNPYPCYGGNGVRGYVDNYTQEGDFPIIGRQGALCGNVQFAHGRFRNTEHAVLVTPIIPMNKTWLYELLKLENLFRFHTGAAQPGLAVKTLNEVRIPIAPLELQEQYADFYFQAEKSSSAIQKSIEETQLLVDSLMQEYFG